MKKDITGLVIVAMLATVSCTDVVESSSAFNTAAQKLTHRGGDEIIATYYNTTIQTVHLAELTPSSEATLIAQDSSLNVVYQSDTGLPGNKPFVSVIDAEPSSNPVCREWQIVFNSGFTPHQFISHEEIVAAASGPAPEITLTMTKQVYQCTAVGH